MINNNEIKLIEELREIRFLDSDKEDDDEIEEKIERYEEILFELSKSKDISIISELCSIAEDNATELSAVEYLLKVILNIVRNNDLQDGMIEIIKGTEYMIPHAYQKAIKLHIWIIKDEVLRKKYIYVLKNINDKQKIMLKDIINSIKGIFGDELNLKEIIDLV